MPPFSTWGFSLLNNKGWEKEGKHIQCYACLGKLLATQPNSRTPFQVIKITFLSIEQLRTRPKMGIWEQLKNLKCKVPSSDASFQRSRRKKINRENVCYLHLPSSIVYWAESTENNNRRKIRRRGRGGGRKRRINTALCWRRKPLIAIVIFSFVRIIN